MGFEQFDSVEMCNCETTLLRDIAELEMKRRDVAQTYRLALQSSEFDSIDWAKVNRAIIERWSLFGLNWIKKQAWSGRAFT